jgi:hypothetical protein
VRQLPQRRYGAETPAKFDLNIPNREKHGELKITLSFFHYWSPSANESKQTMKILIVLTAILATVGAYCPNGCSKNGSCGLNGEAR